MNMNIDKLMIDQGANKINSILTYVDINKNVKSLFMSIFDQN
jgi:hypothetical protein